MTLKKSFQSTKERNKKYIIKLTGYVFNPHKSAELVRLSETIKSFFKKGYMFLIVTGGGLEFREWLNILRKYSKSSEYELDHLGILFSRLNAEILKRLLYPFVDKAIPESIEEAIALFKEEKRNIVMGGVSPGFSTNAVAASLSARLGLPLINMTRAGGVYDKDPEVYKDAKKLDRVTVSLLIKMLSEEYEAAGHYPLFDLTSLKIIKEYNINVYVIPANKESLEKILEGKHVGTIIESR